MNILSQIVLLVILSMSWSNTHNPNDTCTYESNDMKYQIDITINNECTNISAAVAFLVNRINTNISSTNCSLCINNLKSDSNMLLTSSDLFISNNPQSSLLISTVTTSPLSNWLSTTTIITNSTSNCLSHDSCHVAVYSLLGLIIIISFSLNIVVLCALVIEKNKTNKSLSSNNNTQETEAIVELRDYRQEENLYQINQTEDIEHDTMYAVINKSQPPPLPPSYDIDHSTLYTTTIGEHGPVYDVAIDFEEEGDTKVMKRPSQYESPP